MSETSGLKAEVDAILERVLVECGGVGRLQWLLMLVVLGSKIAITWSMLMMTFAGATPDWWCAWQNRTSGFNASYSESLKSCIPPVNTSTDDACLSIRFSEDKNTIVNEVIIPYVH
jgi:hypothetical protein